MHPPHGREKNPHLSLPTPQFHQPPPPRRSPVSDQTNLLLLLSVSNAIHTLDLFPLFSPSLIPTSSSSLPIFHLFPEVHCCLLACRSPRYHRFHAPLRYDTPSVSQKVLTTRLSAPHPPPQKKGTQGRDSSISYLLLSRPATPMKVSHRSSTAGPLHQIS